MVLFALYVFSIPTFSGRSGLNYLLYGVLGLLGGCSLLYCVFYKRNSYPKTVLFVPAFALFAFLGTAIFSHDFRGWLTMFLLAISFVAMFLSFLAMEDTKVIFNLVIFSFFIFTIYYIFHYRSEILHFSSYGTEAFRLGTDFANENDVALFAIIALSFTFHELCFAKSYFKLIYLIPSLTTLLVGLTTGSRTFIIAAGIIILVILFFRFIKHKILYFFVIIVLVVIFIILLSTPFMETIRTRLTKMFETFFGKTTNQIDYSSVSRSIWFDYGFTLGSKNLLIGYGYAGFSIFSGVGTFTHSNFTEVLCDFGIIGLFLFYTPYVIFVSRCYKTKNRHLPFVIVLVVSFAILSFSMVYFYNKFYYIVLSVCYFISYNEELMVKVNPYDSEDNKTILLIGNSGRKSGDKGGQTTKLRLYQKKIIDEGFDVNFVELESFMRHPFKVFTSINEGLKTCRRVVLISGERACRLLIPFIVDRNKRKVPFVLPVVGSGVLHLSIDKLSDEQKLEFFNKKKYELGKRIKSIEENLSEIPKILVETPLLKEIYSDFYHLKNCEVLQNFRDEETRHREERIHSPMKAIYLSRVMRLKGIFDLLEVAKNLENDYSEKLIIDIYGSKEFNKEDEDTFNAYSNSIINYRGPLNNDEVINKLREYDLLVFPTRAVFEGTPGVIAESLIAGTPILSSEFPQADSLLIKNKDSIWFKMFDVVDFENKFRTLLDDSSIVLELMKHCQDSAQKYTYTYHRDRFIKYICGVRK